MPAELLTKRNHKKMHRRDRTYRRHVLVAVIPVGLLVLTSHAHSLAASRPDTFIEGNATTHAIQNLHKFKFDNTKILHIEQNYNKRLFIEMTEILKSKAVNFNTDISNLSHTYFNLICS